MSRRLTKRTINKIRREVVGGKSKYQVAKEMGLLNQTVHYITRDIPSKKPGRTEIRGKTLELLKQIVREGYVVATNHTSSQFRTLRKHFPMIQRAEIDHQVIYFFNDKNKIALQEMIQQKQSHLISYTDLAHMAHIFGISLSPQERKSFIGKKVTQRRKKLHRPSGDSYLENADSLVDFYIPDLCENLKDRRFHEKGRSDSWSRSKRLKAWTGFSNALRCLVANEMRISPV